MTHAKSILFQEITAFCRAAADKLEQLEGDEIVFPSGWGVLVTHTRVRFPSTTLK